MTRTPAGGWFLAVKAPASLAPLVRTVLISILPLPLGPRTADPARKRRTRELRSRDEPHERSEAPRRGRADNVQPRHRGLQTRPEPRVPIDLRDLSEKRLLQKLVT